MIFWWTMLTLNVGLTAHGLLVGRVNWFAVVAGVMSVLAIMYTEWRKRHGPDEGDHDSTQDSTASGSTLVQPLSAALPSIISSAYTYAPGASSGGSGRWGSWGNATWAYHQMMQPTGIGGGGTTPTKKRFSATPTAQDAPVYGWRAYSLSREGVLKGDVEEWPEREKAAVCRNSGQYQLTAERDAYMKANLPMNLYALWRQSAEAEEDPSRTICLQHLEHDSCPGQHGCGIWGRAKPDRSAMVVAHCLAYGTVASDEDGNWRASDVRIEALYVVKQYFYNWVNSVWDHFSSHEPHFLKYIDFDRMAADLYSRYVVPVKVIDSLEELSGD